VVPRAESATLHVSTANGAGSLRSEAADTLGIHAKP
jgi:hypothetical protein